MKIENSKILVTESEYSDLKKRKQIIENHEGEYILFRGYSYKIVKLFSNEDKEHG